MMKKPTEMIDMAIESCALQQEENGRIPVTTIWKWDTPEEANAFLEGVVWVSDGAQKAWIDRENPSDVLVYDDETIDDDDEWPTVRHGGE